MLQGNSAATLKAKEFLSGVQEDDCEHFESIKTDCIQQQLGGGRVMIHVEAIS